MKIIKLLIIPALLIVGCNSKKDQTSSDEIAGTYVMEKTYEVRHEATGEPVGMATLRDTIIITKISDGYEVKNRKWKKNEFDDDGWVRQEHGSSPVFNAIYEPATSTLQSQPVGLFASLQFDSNLKRFLRGKNKVPYIKAN